MDTQNIAAIIIRNSRGEYFAHQRSPHKKTFPNLYGLGAGGHIQTGETAAAAARRELMEETGVQGEPEFLFTIPFTAYNQTYDVHVFVAQVNTEIRPDEHEWQWSGWLSGAEVDALVAEHKLMPDTTLFYERYKREALGARSA